MRRHQDEPEKDRQRQRLGGLKHFRPSKSVGFEFRAADPASFSSKGNLVDTTTGLGVEGGAQLQVELCDAPPADGGDQIAITFYRKTGGFWYTIKWTGVKTVKKLIESGGTISITPGM